MTVSRQSVLDEAKLIVSHDRNQQYGSPEQNFRTIAELWTVYLGAAIEPHDVAVLMMLVKIARIGNSPWVEDHWIDAAGYAACGAEVKPPKE